MKISLPTNRFVWAVIILCLGIHLPGAYGESSCEQAEALYQRASIQQRIAAQAEMLEEAVRLCPAHAKAWQNLGLAYEEQKKLDAAARAYGQANELDPNLGSPLAGLGDVAMRRGRFEAAAQWYKQFLAFLEADKLRGNPRNLGIFQGEYQDKYDRALLMRQIHLASIDAVVPAKTILRGLKPITPRERMKTAFEMQRLSLSIHFDFNSAALQQQGRAQLDELAKAMSDPELNHYAYLVEGHSDLFGEQNYNLELSRERAKMVSQYLSVRGIDPKRLRTEGFGETRPLITKGDKAAQRVNRRVEFVQFDTQK
jgi:outer membrane protein OmpA-like peptidoglycan-associated protein